MSYATRETVQRLTGGKVKFAAQRRRLKALGIPFREASNGEPLVRERDLDTRARRARNVGPRWDLIGAKG